MSPAPPDVPGDGRYEILRKEKESGTLCRLCCFWCITAQHTLHSRIYTYILWEHSLIDTHTHPYIIYISFTESTYTMTRRQAAKKAKYTFDDVAGDSDFDSGGGDSVESGEWCGVCATSGRLLKGCCVVDRSAARIYAYPLTHSRICSLTHSFTHSFIHSLIHTFTHSHINSLTLTHIHTFSHLLTLAHKNWPFAFISHTALTHCVTMCKRMILSHTLFTEWWLHRQQQRLTKDSTAKEEDFEWKRNQIEVDQ